MTESQFDTIMRRLDRLDSGPDSLAARLHRLAASIDRLPTERDIYRHSLKMLGMTFLPLRTAPGALALYMHITGGN